MAPDTTTTTTATTEVNDAANGNGDAPKDVELKIHTEEGSPWPNVSPELDAKMMENVRKPFDFSADNFKINRVDDEGKPVIAPASSYSFMSFSDLRDCQNRPLDWNKRYYFKEANVPKERKRMLDYENGNKKKVVFNSKGHDGLHLVFDNHMLSGNKPGANIIGIRYPGGSDWRGSDWLLGMLSGSSDVTLGKNQLSSQWMFEPAGFDTYGEPHYRIYSMLSSPAEIGGTWFPNYSAGRAGYDKDWEWATYDGTNAKNGFFTVKFERFSYSE